MLELLYADVYCSTVSPSEICTSANQIGVGSQVVCECSAEESGQNYNIGGLSWRIPHRQKMEDYMLFWIGLENPAFSNVALTFNNSEIVRYDATKDCLVTDVSEQKKMLKRRYYLVEKGKDANMIGILVGTLGAAGYLHMIHQMRDLITQAGKKSYAFVMGRPNPAKLANFPSATFLLISLVHKQLYWTVRGS